MHTTQEHTGAQRLSRSRLDQWRDLRYGMFIHFGMSTFSPDKPPNHARGDFPTDMYCPDVVDPDQWVSVAKEAGMQYAILTARHINGFALWPTRQNDYSVAHAPVKTNVVGCFVEACQKHGIRPALYINAGDHHTLTKEQVLAPDKLAYSFVTRRYIDYLLAQLEELLTGYGPLEELWIDGSSRLGALGRREVYDFCASAQPDMIVAMNGAWNDDGRFPEIHPHAWPSDVHIIEAGVPPIWGTHPTRELDWDPMGRKTSQRTEYYLPIEVCTLAHTSGHGWFWSPRVEARKVEELLGLRLLCNERHSNLVLNVTPGPGGCVPDDQARALIETQRQYSRCTAAASATG